MSIPQNSSDVLVSELADDEDMLELIEMFVGDFPDRIAELERAIDERDIAELARLAHQLKGSAGGYGFPTITDTAELLEATAMAGGELETVAQQVSAINDLCRRARATGVLPSTL